MLCLLLAYQACLPDSVTLLRGNHEDSVTINLYGFEKEVLNYPGERTESRHAQLIQEWSGAAANVLDDITRIFTWLPLMAILRKVRRHGL